MHYRRLTPSMSLLLVFEAAARHESYTRAAEELALSQSAVSRQIQTLESQLGISLFRRQGRSVQLTELGRRYAAEVVAALGRIRAATLQAMSQQEGGALRLATLPTHGSKWLLPRLHDFYRSHAGVTLHIHSRIGAIDFNAQELDAAITVGGVGDWPDLRAHCLHNEFLVAIASPEALNGKPATPEWIASQTLLTVASNQKGWAQWFSHNGLDHRQMKVGPSFELTSHLMQAVRAGMGVGLVPRALIDDEDRRLGLVEVGAAMVSERSYYLVYPERNETLPALAAFRAWLLAQHA